jgi:hypothetical protein
MRCVSPSTCLSAELKLTHGDTVHPHHAPRMADTLPSPTLLCGLTLAWVVTLPRTNPAAESSLQTLGLPEDSMCELVALVGMVLAATALVQAVACRAGGTATTLAALWVLYLSLFVVGQKFLAFQWDLLLLEVGFLAIWLVPMTVRTPWLATFLTVGSQWCENRTE